MPPRNEPAADLHSPEELLATAEALVALGDPQMYRAAVLEAITALESCVALTVFERLELLLDPLLVQWLRDHTRMDFDSRLSVLTPVATGRPVDTRGTLAGLQIRQADPQPSHPFRSAGQPRTSGLRPIHGTPVDGVHR